MKTNDLKKFVLYWAINSAILFTVNYLIPDGYELGNMNFQPFMAGIVAGFALTLVGVSAKIFARGMDLQKRGRYPMLLYYSVANAIGIWVIARVADLTGFGIARYYWAILLGFITSALHWGVRQALKKV